MDRVPSDILCQIILEVHDSKDLVELVLVNSHILRIADIDKVWKHFLTLLQQDLLKAEEVNIQIPFYEPPWRRLAAILKGGFRKEKVLSGFKQVFQDLKAEFCQVFLMMEFYEYDLQYEENVVKNTSFFVSPTRYLFKEFQDELCDVEDQNGEIIECGMTCSVFKWVENDVQLSKYIKDIQDLDRDKLVEVLQSKNLIYSKFKPDEIKSIINAMHHRCQYENKTFYEVKAIYKLQRITVKQFFEVVKEANFEIQNDIKELFP